MLIYLRCVQKRRQNRELAESMEDARIYASAMANHPEGMQMKPMDQMSITSQQSSLLSHKPAFSSVSSFPNGNAAAPKPPMATSQQHLPISTTQSSSNNGVQYVQLSNGMLVPISSLQPQMPQTRPQPEQRPPAPTPVQQPIMQPLKNPPQQAQALQQQQQQLQQQMVQLQQLQEQHRRQQMKQNEAISPIAGSQVPKSPSLPRTSSQVRKNYSLLE